MRILILLVAVIGFFSTNSFSQNDCCNADILMDGSPVTIASSSGNGMLETLSSCSCLAGNEHDSHWFVFEAQTSGTFEMMITPTGFSGDFDFALYGNDCPCGGGTTVVSCDYTGPITPPGPFVTTGISSTPMATFGTPGTTEWRPTVNITAGVTYYIIADNITTNGAGFTIEFAGTATIGPPPTIGSNPLGPVSGTTASCPGADEDFSVVPIPGISNYNWTIDPPLATVTPQGSANVSINFSLEGTYQVCVAGQEGCVTSDESCITVDITSIPEGNMSASACFGEPYIAPDGNSYFAPGFYQLVYPSYQGCDSIINLNLDANFSSFNDVLAEICPGNCFNLNGVDYCESGFWEVTYPGANYLGCDSTDFVTVIAVPYFAEYFPNPPDAIDCVNQVVTLDGSASFVGNNPTYEWTDSDGNIVSNDALFDAMMGGTYTLTVYSETGGSICQVSVDAIIEEEIDGPDITAIGGDIDCLNTSIDLTGDSNSPGVTYAWTGPNSFTSQEQNPNVIDIGTYTLTVTAPNGCTSQADADVIGDTNEPNVDAFGEDIDCNNSEANLTGNSITLGVTYAWGGPNSFVSDEQNPVVDEPGQYILIVTAPNGCTAEAIVDVVGDSVEPDILASGTTIDCNNLGPTISGSSATPDVTFEWTGPNNFNAFDPSPAVFDSGDYTLVVTALNGCTATADVLVEEDINVPDVSAVGGTIDCSDPTLMLEGGSNTSGATFAWTGPNSFTSNLATPEAGAAGIYTLVVTGTNGCTAMADAEVIQNADIPEVSASGGTIDCNFPMINLTSVSNDPTVTFAWSGPNSFTSEEQNPEINTAGNYIIIVTAANGCTAEALAIVGDDFVEPDAASDGGLLTCTATSVMLTGSSTTTDVVYSWEGPGGFESNDPSPMVTEAGMYTLTVTSTNGCTTASTATVDLAADLPEAFAVGATINCDNSTVQIEGSSPTPNVTIAWTGPNNFMSNDLMPMVVEPGQYVLTVTAPGDCSTTATALVEADLDGPVVNAPLVEITCADPQAILETTTNDNIASYSWTGPNSFSSNIANPIVDQPGMYELTIIGTNGCDNVQQFSVTADQDLPDISTEGATLTCNDTVVEISGTTTVADATFAWTGPNGFESDQTNPMVSDDGDYILTIIADNGCVVSDSVLVAEDMEDPDIQVVGGAIDCGDPIVNIEGISSQAILFEWTGPNSFESNDPNPMVSQGGFYTLLVTGTNGCTNTMDAEVLADFAEPDIMGNGGILTCNQEEINLEGNSSTPGTTYGWTGPNSFVSDEQMPLIDEDGTYTLTVTGSNDCFSTLDITVTADLDEPNVAAIGGILDCNDPNVDLQGTSTTAGVSYSWVGPGGIMFDEQNPNVTVAGDYILTVTGTNGCTATAQTLVDQDADLPDAAAIGGTIDCNFPNIDVSASSMTNDVTFAWTGPNGFESDQQNIVVEDPGAYSVIVSSPNGCTAEAIAMVEADLTEPDVMATGGEITCTVPSATLNASSSTPDVTYLWIGQGGFTSEDPVVTVTEAGNYGVIVTAPNGCTTSINNVMITQDADVPVASIEDETLNCEISSIELTATTNQSDLTFAWTGPNGFVSDLENPTVSDPGTYTLVITAMNDCSATASALVIDDSELPIIEIIPPEEFDCNTDLISIDAQNSTNGNGISVVWTTSDGSILSGGNTLNPVVDQSGTYSLQITNANNGCESIQSIEVNESGDTPSDAAINLIHPSCFGDTDGQIIIDDVVGGTPPYTYSLNGAPFVLTNQFSLLQGGDYDLIIQDDIGCEWATAVGLIEPVELQVELVIAGGTNEVKLGESVNLDAQITVPESNLASIIWNNTDGFAENCDSCLNPQVTPLISNNYEITVIDENGCIASDNIQIIVDRERPFYVPNVFSPNNDGFNDLLLTFGGASVANVKSFRIFNRWGEAVYEAYDFPPNDVQYGWDGTFRGKTMETGVFIYFAEVDFIDGDTEIFKGDIMVIK